MFSVGIFGFNREIELKLLLVFVQFGNISCSMFVNVGELLYKENIHPHRVVSQISLSSL